MASGIAYADPGETVVALSGDGGFLYTPQWLFTAQESAVNVKIIVFKNGAYSLPIQTAAAQGRPSPDTFMLGIRRAKVKI
jgi:thiamine pyrophosphate-dependent acetolactate synthase large subunit-like protein